MSTVMAQLGQRCCKGQDSQQNRMAQPIMSLRLAVAGTHLKC